jgi:hypothetical protein
MADNVDRHDVPTTRGQACMPHNTTGHQQLPLLCRLASPHTTSIKRLYADCFELVKLQYVPTTQSCWTVIPSGPWEECYHKHHVDEPAAGLQLQKKCESCRATSHVLGRGSSL